MPNEFTLSKTEPTIKIEGKDGILEISKDSDENIIFKSNKNKLHLNINYYSTEFDEWQCYQMFHDFFHRVVGKYCIESIGRDSYDPEIPADFVNYVDRKITYHSDKVNLGNELVITDGENKIDIALLSSGPVRPARVMVSKADSGYDGYYKEFDKLYKVLCGVAIEEKGYCQTTENQKTK